MQYRIDERTGAKLSVLGFGCMRFPRGVGGIDKKKTEQLIMRAIDAGVNYFDTAYLYPGSEAVLGEVLAANRARERVLIATKLPVAFCKKTEDFDRFFAVQLASLKTDYVDFYLMHNINSFRQWQELRALGIEDWIGSQKASGKIRRAGFSFHGTGADFLQVLDSRDWDFCQIQYNYSDENYQAGVTGLKRAAAKKIPVIIMEPLLGGKLATGLPKQAEEILRRVNPSLSPAAWGLRWLLDQSEVTVILSGMNRAEQVAENLATAEECRPGMLTQTERDAYEKVVGIFRKSYKVPCTGCAYCMPCPHQVNIPGCFAAYNTSFSLGWITGIWQYATSTGAHLGQPRTASRCTGCGACERQCPQHIPIPAKLKDVKRRLEPLPFRIAMAVMRKRAK